MKGFKRILFLLLIIPVCFAFSSCKKGSDSDSENGGSENNQNGNVSTESFSVAYDYNLPEKYDFLLTDFTDSNNSIGSSVELATISDINLAPYFLGWYNSFDERVSGSVTSSVATTINLKGKWNEEDIDKFYYTNGLTFEIDGAEAKVLSFSGSASGVVIPNLYVSNANEYPVTSIADSVFADSNVESLIINSSSLSIGNSVFKNSKLTNFDFSVINEIGESSFENTRLSTVEFSKNLTSIGNNAFKSCESLTTVDFSELEIDVSDNMFYGCKNLSVIENASKIESIGDYSFAGCEKLKNTNFLQQNSKIKSLGQGSFLNCTGLESVLIPESVSEVLQPFEGCLNVSSITLSKTYAEFFNGSDKLIDHIGNIASNVKTITFVGNSVSRLIKNYFYGFGELETFVMCDSIVYVEDFAFRYCVKLQNIILSNNIDLNSFSYNAFYSTIFLNDRTEPLVYKGSIIYVPQNIVSEYEIPSDVVSINSSAFAYRTSLTKITIPANVEKIGENAFEGCSNLTEVVFAENSKITKIDNYVFMQCNKLSVIDLSKLTNLSEIGIESFKNVNISQFVIPSTVTKIGIGAFVNARISEFEILGENEKYSVIDGVLYEKISEQGSDAEFKLCSYPKMKEGTLFICPTDVTMIASYAFSGANYLKYVYFSQDEIEWESSQNAVGNTIYSSFVNTIGIKILKEKSTFEVMESGVDVYSLITSGWAYNYEDNVIEFDTGFKPASEYCFLKVLDDDKFSIVMFRFDFDANEPAIIEGSMVKLEKVLSE